MFITMFTTAGHTYLSQARLIQSTPSHLNSHKSNLMYPIDALVFRLASYPHVSPPQPSMHLSSPPNCYMSPSSHFFFNCSPDWCWVRRRDLLQSSGTVLSPPVLWYCTLSSSPLVLYCTVLSPSQHPILEHPQPMFVPHCDRPGFKPIKTAGSITVRHILRFTQRTPSNCTTMASSAEETLHYLALNLRYI